VGNPGNPGRAEWKKGKGAVLTIAAMDREKSRTGVAGGDAKRTQEDGVEMEGGKKKVGATTREGALGLKEEKTLSWRGLPTGKNGRQLCRWGEQTRR